MQVEYLIEMKVPKFLVVMLKTPPTKREHAYKNMETHPFSSLQPKKHPRSTKLQLSHGSMARFPYLSFLDFHPQKFRSFAMYETRQVKNVAWVEMCCYCVVLETYNSKVCLDQFVRLYTIIYKSPFLSIWDEV